MSAAVAAAAADDDDSGDGVVDVSVLRLISLDSRLTSLCANISLTFKCR